VADFTSTCKSYVKNY